MVDSIINGIVTFVLEILGWLGGLLLTPITALLEIVFPDMEIYVQYVTQAFSYVFQGLAFAKEVFCNISGANIGIINLFITILLTKYTVKATLNIIKFIKNMYSLFRRGTTK